MLAEDVIHWVRDSGLYSLGALSQKHHSHSGPTSPSHRGDTGDSRAVDLYGRTQEIPISYRFACKSAQSLARSLDWDVFTLWKTAIPAL